ncbi:hypothetical protein CEE45_02985 [Candidatus Heimdallarchaeota archaeon B3_Heim]|nr:MAG: hypothetical protein CEE45_02985 [Candidatus Heimdallarchaeota archaeon B3_Heim]
MVRRYEILRNNIHTILSRISLYAKNYTKIEKEILFKFTSVLMHYQEAEFQREKLITRLDDYIEENTGTNLYLQTPFLCFSREFCTKANLILKEAKYHAEDFYTYIINNLRAIFKLVHNYTSLLDIDAFESLQYRYNRFKVPLSREQLQNVELLFFEINNSGYLALDPLHVKTVYCKNRDRTKIAPDVSTFFKLLDIRIILFFYRHAFDLEHFYINFQLTENISLKEVVDLHDSANTLLCNSNVLHIRETSNSFIGLLTSPITCHDSLKAYFKKKDRQGKIIIHEMMNLNLTHLHHSLALYRPDKGWRDLNKTQRKVLTKRLLTKNPRKKRKNNLPQFFLSPSSDSTWNFKQHDQPEELIKLFCEVSREFTS